METISSTSPHRHLLDTKFRKINPNQSLSIANSSPSLNLIESQHIHSFKPEFHITKSPSLYESINDPSIISANHQQKTMKNNHQTTNQIDEWCPPSNLDLNLETKLSNLSKDFISRCNEPIPQPSDRLSREEYQKISELLFRHFTVRRKLSDPDIDPIPIDYSEEDPNTWPSNWQSQAPLMILEPENYLAQKPTLNEYQRRLIRRISLKYEPLFQYYRRQINNTSKKTATMKISSPVHVQHDTTQHNSRRDVTIMAPMPITTVRESFLVNNNNVDVDNDIGSTRITKQYHQPTIMYKSSNLSSPSFGYSFSSSFSYYPRSTDSINNKKHSQEQTHYCRNNNQNFHIQSMMKTPTIHHNDNLRNEDNGIQDDGYRQENDDDTEMIEISSSKIPKGSLVRNSVMDNPMVATTISKIATTVNNRLVNKHRQQHHSQSHQNSLAKLSISSIHFGKWSAKMKDYLRKN